MSSHVYQTSPPIPIILIAGYLGSGKTTYLNRLLSEANGRKLAILVNDFGAINIDANLIDGSVDDVVALQNGCICCSMASGMQSAILKVLKRESKPEVILIEASGVANPGEIIKILSDISMRPFAPLELVISMLDCQNLTSYKPIEMGLVKEQIRYSGIVMLTKLGQSSSEDIVYAKKIIQENNPGSVIIEDYQKIRNIDLLLSTKQEALKSEGINSVNIQANELFRSWNYSSADPMSEAEFQKVLQDLPPDTVRGKGFLYLKNYPTIQLEFQMVGKTAQIQPKGDWGFQNPRTEIVFIALKN